MMRTSSDVLTTREPVAGLGVICFFFGYSDFASRVPAQSLPDAVHESLTIIPLGQGKDDLLCSFAIPRCAMEGYPPPPRD